MGLFDSDIVVSGAMSVQPLITDLPDIRLPKDVLHAVLGERDVGKAVTYSQLNTFSNHVRSYFDYAQDKYTFANARTAFAGYAASEYRDAVIAIIEAAEGEPITHPDVMRHPFYLSILYPTGSIILDEYLGNDLSTDWRKATVAEEQTAWINGIVNKHTNDIFGVRNAVFNNDTVTVFYQKFSWTPDAALYFGGTLSWIGPMLSFSFTVSHIVSTDIIFYARYTLMSTGERKTWLYNIADNTYPELNITFPAGFGGRALPIAYIVHNSQVLADNYAGDYAVKANDSKNLLHKLGIDFDEFTDNMRDPEDTSNLDDIQQAFIGFTINIVDEDEISLSYIYSYFRLQYLRIMSELVFNNSTEQEWHDNRNGGNDGNYFTDLYWLASRIYTISSFIRSHITYHFIRITVQSGVVTGTHSAPDMTTIPADPVSEIDPNNNGEGKITRDIYHNVAHGDGSTDYNNVSILVIRKQLTTVADGDASDTFVELVVSGLGQSVSIEIFEDDGENSGHAHNIELPLDDDPDTAKPFLFVSYDLVQEVYNTWWEAKIYAKSLNFLVFAAAYEKLKWYESSAFLDFLGAVLFIVAIFFNVEELAALVIDGLTAAVAETIITQYIYGVIAIQILEVIVELVGGNLALALAALATVYAAYLGKDGTAFFDMLNAEKLLQGATLMAIATDNVSADIIEDALRGLEEEQLREDERQEELERANDLLDNKLDLELYSINGRSTYIDFIETPTEFYNRTVHRATGPGQLALDGIAGYVDMALTLPSGLRT